jgi:hypothetical protein
MKTQASLSKSFLTVALVTALILLIPLIAMQFNTGVDWSIADFIIMGMLIFGTGSAYVLVTRLVNNLVYRIAIAFSLGTTFLMIWANLAVGLIGSGPHAGNMMYLGVIAVGIIGTIFSRFTSTGLERTMYAMAFAVVLVAVIALMANMQNYPGSSVTEIIGVNGFFAMLFTVAGLLFRYVAIEQSQHTQKSQG